jgi:hypothetical protein
MKHILQYARERTYSIFSMHRARAGCARGFDSLPSLSDVGTFSFRWILPFWYFCFLLAYKARQRGSLYTLKESRSIKTAIVINSWQFHIRDFVATKSTVVRLYFKKFIHVPPVPRSKFVLTCRLSGWPSGLRRQPDALLYILFGVWVQIPATTAMLAAAAAALSPVFCRKHWWYQHTKFK